MSNIFSDRFVLHGLVSCQSFQFDESFTSYFLTPGGDLYQVYLCILYITTSILSPLFPFCIVSTIFSLYSAALYYFPASVVPILVRILPNVYTFLGGIDIPPSRVIRANIIPPSTAGDLSNHGDRTVPWDNPSEIKKRRLTCTLIIDLQICYLQVAGL